MALPVVLVVAMVLFIAVVRVLAEQPQPDPTSASRTVVVGETAINPSAVETDRSQPVVASTDRTLPASTEPAAAPNVVRFTARPIEPTYTVAQGDNLYTIAQRHGTTAEAIRGMNNMSDSFLRVGQQLVLP
jgi:LysM repeat protein